MATPKTNLPSKRTGETKRADYTLNGQAIEVTRKPGRPWGSSKRTRWYNQDVKVRACAIYCVYGDLEQTHKLTDVPIEELKKWKQESWWLEITKQVYVEQNEKLAGTISAVLNRTLDQLIDRLDNGDYTFDERRGEFRRSPINAKILTNMFTALNTQRRLIRGEPTAISSKIGIDDRLEKLKEQFEKFTKTKTIEGVALRADDNEEIIDGTRSVGGDDSFSEGLGEGEDYIWEGSTSSEGCEDTATEDGRGIEEAD